MKCFPICATSACQLWHHVIAVTGMVCTTSCWGRGEGGGQWLWSFCEKGTAAPLCARER